MKPLTNIVIFSRDNCTYCTQAKALLDQRGIPFTEIDLDETAKTFLVSSGLKTVPQIFANGDRIGGFEDLRTALGLFHKTAGPIA